MAAVTVHSDFGPQENEICHCFHFSPSICCEVIGLDAIIFIFWMLNFKPTFSLSSFIFLKKPFSSSSLSAIRVVSSAYLGLLVFLLAILILVYDLSSMTFRMMYSAYKFNKQGENTQPWRIPFPKILTQSVVSCPVLTVASWPTYRFLRRQVRWSGTPIILRIFNSLLWFTQSKNVSVVNKAEVDVFLESEIHSIVSDSLWPHEPYSPWNSPGQNFGNSSCSLLQGIFPIQGSNPGLPHCRWILYQLSHKGRPRILEWVAYSFSSGSSCPRSWTGVSCIASRFFTNWAFREAPPCFLHDPTNVGYLISGSSASSKPSLYIWKFSVHENFQRC